MAGSSGAASKLKFKGVQELSLINIDCFALKGKRVSKAELHLHGEGDVALGRMTVSTIPDVLKKVSQPTQTQSGAAG